MRNEKTIGWFEKIRNAPPSQLMTQSEFEKAIKKAEKDSARRTKENNARIKQNQKHLIQRSKELGKEIPILLGVVLCSSQMQYVGEDFIKKYEEWL